jgi:hypothetical protein
VTTVVSEPREFLVELSVRSAILDATGDTLVGDTVKFNEVVTLDGEPITASTPRFESSEPAVVRILDEETGDAVFDSTGTAIVTVTYSGEVFPDSLLRAGLRVPVSRYTADLSVTSVELFGRPLRHFKRD